MPTAKVTLTDGTVVRLEHVPRDTPTATLEAMAREQAGRGTSGLRAATAPSFMGISTAPPEPGESAWPDIAGAAAGAVPVAGTLFKATRPFVAPAAKASWPWIARAGTKALPFAERVLASEAGQRGTERAMGRPETPWYMGGGAKQAAGEAVLGLPLRWALTSAGARAARGAHAQAVKAGQEAYESAQSAAAREFESGQERGRVATAMGEQVQESRARHFEKTMATYREAVPARFMAWARKTVDAFKQFPETLAGLDKVASLEGQQAMSAAFDPYLKDVIARGGKLPVTLRIVDADALGLQAMPGSVLTPEAARVLQGRGPLPNVAPQGFGVYHAGDAAERITGEWTKHPDLYARVTGALNDLGLIDKTVSGQYRLGQAARQVIRGSKAITTGPQGELVFDVDAFRKGLTVGAKPSGQLERRGVPDEFARELLAGRPTAPPKVTIPDFAKGVTKREVPKPTDIPEPAIRTRKNPLASHPWSMGLMAEAAYGGATGGHGAGVPFLAGAGVSTLLPKEFVTAAPLTAAQEFAGRLAPAVTGGAVKLSPEGYRAVRDRWRRK